MSSELSKCTACKKDKDLTLFMKNNVKLKCCFNCREKSRLNKIKTKCPHGKRKDRCIHCGGIGLCIHKKQKSHCVDCDGVSICIHKKRKYICIDCKGIGLCIHKKQKEKCKICGNKFKITIKNMINRSKQTDKKFNIFNESEFVDYPFLENLIKESNLICYYPFCKKKLNLDKVNPDMASIERLDNKIGHIKSNCVICCLECNIKRVGNKFN